MRICIFNWRDEENPAAGGAEVYTHEVAAHWVSNGHTVTIVAAGFKGAAKLTTRPDGVVVERVGNKYTVYNKARAWWAATGHTRGFDVVIDEVNTRPFLAHQWVKGVPVVAFAHQVCREVWWYQAPLPGALVGRFIFEPWWLSRLSKQPTVTVSLSSKVSLERYGVTDVRVIPEGGNMPSAQTDVVSNVPTVVFVGRLVGAKRPSHAIRAFEHARVLVPKAQMWVIGSGPKLARLTKNAPPGVFMLGRVSLEERNSRVAQATALVATSVREGWGLVVSEAAAVGTVTVGYDVPGLRDSIMASGGVLAPADPVLLGEVLAQTLLATKRPQPTASGVEPWSVVADRFMCELVQITNTQT